MYKVHPKEKIYFNVMAGISILLYAVAIKGLLNLNKTVLIYCAIFGVLFLLQLIGSLFLLGHLKGNSIKIDENQLPDIYALVKNYSERLGLSKVPEVYLLQGNGLLNAFATKIAKKNYVVIYSDVLEIAYDEGIEAVSFIIGHELGHIKRNHLSFLKHLLILPANMIPFLGLAYSRGREYTCDAIGYSLSSYQGHKGLLFLGCGKKLYKKISTENIIQTQSRISGFSVWLAEVFSSHPLLLKRIIEIHRLNQENLLEKDPFVTPHLEKNQEIQN